MNKNIKHWVTASAVAASGLAIVAAATGFASASPNSANAVPVPNSSASSSASASASPSVSSLTADQKAVLDSLSLRQHKNEYVCTNTDPKTGLLQVENIRLRGVDKTDINKLENSFAIGLRLPASLTAQQVFSAFQSNNCADTLQGYLYGWVLANTQVYNTHIGSISGNDFVISGGVTFKDMVGMSLADVSKLASAHDPAVPATTATDSEKAAYVVNYEKVNSEFKQYVENVNTLYGQLQNLGVMPLTSSVNWETTGPSLGYADLQEGPQESLPGLALAITEKGKCAPVAVIMINVLDQRPERAIVPGCTPTKRVTPPPPTSKTCPSGEVFSTTPGYTSVCVEAKNINVAPTPIKHVTPLPVTGPGSATPSPKPSDPIDPTLAPGAPVTSPAPGSSPAPTPKPSDPPVVSDPPVTGPTPAPTPIADPDK